MKILITGGSGFIGTNLVEFLQEKYKYLELFNIDLKSPQIQSHLGYWIKCDINDYENLRDAILEISPDYIIHLAAEADVKFTSLSDFKTNILGVRNLCEVINECSSIKRTIFTSTQYVNQFHGHPKRDDEYSPFTIYGESKVEGEKIVRSFGLNKMWTIIRPTNVYGPYNDVYVGGLFKVVAKGAYFHPNKNVKRSYGFVGNVVEQITNILFAAEEAINGQTFYVSDEPIWLLDFVAAVHKNLSMGDVKKLPVWVFHFAALVGEVAKKINVGFPMHMTRFTNMVTPNPVEMEKTFSLLGKGKYNFEESMKITIDWYKQISIE